jgi:transposase
MFRNHAWSSKGEKILGFRPGKRFKRTNVIAGQIKNVPELENQIIAPFIYSWNTNSDWFKVWFEWHLFPEVRSGSVIIMDNARFHKKPDLNKIAKFYNCRILWLPPYSPDKNTIEHKWANLKKWLQKYRKNFKSVREAIGSHFQLE